MPDQEVPNYDDFEQKRAEATTKILDSTAEKKLIVAGPGTGKSYLFEQICKHLADKGQRKIHALSFINELVEDLAKDLDGLSEVSTLHSFALGLIPGDTKMFIQLSDIIERDYEILKGDKVDYNQIFCTLSDDQDFNKLESELLFHLSKKNRVVIVGDDDQALYDFKYSEPDEIRKKYSSGDFRTFGFSVIITFA